MNAWGSLNGLNLDLHVIRQALRNRGKPGEVMVQQKVLFSIFSRVKC